MPNMKNQMSQLLSRHIVGNTSEVSKASCSEYIGSQSTIDHCLATRSTITEESDDSDSEIFRVKRRSCKVDLKIVCDAGHVNTEEQVENLSHFCCFRASIILIQSVSFICYSILLFACMFIIAKEKPT